MAPPTLVPDKTTLRRWKREGLTQQEMADRHEAETGIRVSRAAIAAAMVRYGLSGEKPRHKDTLPWRVNAEHLGAYPARMLRLLGRRESGQSLAAENNKRLDGWLAMLEEQDAVVGYDPASEEGFHYIDASYGDTPGLPIRTKRIYTQPVA